MSTTTNAVTWFQIGTDDPAAAEEFYGSLFGWTFESDPEADGPGYRTVRTPGEGGIGGGIATTGDRAANHAVFYVEVEDVAATLAAAEAKGGKVLVPRQATPDGLVFAHLLDPSGNQFAVFTPPTPGPAR
jgi:predicted enzyme related to lactoylglutathione lyase